MDVRTVGMKLTYWKDSIGVEERTTLEDCLDIAEHHGMARSEANRLLHDSAIGEVSLPGIRLWTEEK